ncbi:unnamed protein product [Citrullus colocynthis]|uniref:CSC1/OSCA1-like 7TM region domain-containing protein n=1 Tax=Citrullus colocynthis TaxID=252529 RepID=A0ABP0XU84_9ROSI
MHSQEGSIAKPKILPLPSTRNSARNQQLQKLSRLKIFVPLAFLAWAVVVPVNYTDDNLDIAKVTANVTASDIDKLSISNIPAKSQRIPKTIGFTIPMKATFFITYIMVDGWAGIAGEIMMLKPLILFHLKNIFLVKTEKDREEATVSTQENLEFSCIFY